MSMQHHSAEEAANQERLLEQFMGKAREHFMDGRLNREDQGDLSFAIAADPENNVVLIQFGKPVAWVGLNRKSAEALRDSLTEKLKEIK